MRNGWSTHSSTGHVLRRLLAAGARPEITSNDGTTPMMAAAGCGRWGHWTNTPRAARQPMAEEAIGILIEAGVDVNATNEGRLHGVALRRFQRPQRGDPTARGARRRHRRARLAGPDGVPPRRGRQAVVPLPGVAGDGGPARGARSQYPPGDPGGPSTSACEGWWRPGRRPPPDARSMTRGGRMTPSSGRVDGRDRGWNRDPCGRAEGGRPRGVRPRDEDRPAPPLEGVEEALGSGVVRRGQDAPGARTTVCSPPPDPSGKPTGSPTPCG